MSGTTDSVAVVVLGMHRSGTSVVTEMMSRFGYHTGHDLLPANEFNPRGYWELRRVAEVHDEFLRRFDRTWADPRPLPSSVFEGRHAEWARESLREVLDEEFGDAVRWVVKDPRLCLLLPLWKPLLREVAGQVHVLHVVRDPMSVARSLERREVMRVELGLQLWLRHNLAAELSSRDLDRSWVCFEDILQGEEGFLEAHLERHGLVAGCDLGQGEGLGRVVHSEFVHYPQNGATTAPSEAANPWIRGVAEALADLVRGETGEPLEAVDRFRTLLETADDLLIGDPEGWRLQQREERLRLMFEEVHELRVSMQREVVTRESVMSQLATLRSALSDRLDAAVDTFRVAQNTLENEHQKEFADEVTRGRQRIESLEADLESTRREFELVERRVADASDAVSRQSRQLDYVEKSLSWRVTAPARAILRLIRSFVAPVAGRH